MTDAETKKLTADLVKGGLSKAVAKAQAEEIQAHDHDVVEQTVRPVTGRARTRK